jgi:hypothetical protein
MRHLHVTAGRWTAVKRLSSRTLAHGKVVSIIAAVVIAVLAPPMTKLSKEQAHASFTLPPAPWGEFTPFYGAAPCIPDFQDVGIFSPAEARADALVDKLLKKRILGEDDVKDLRKYDQQDRDRRANRNFYGNLAYRIQTLFTNFEGDSRAHPVDHSTGQTSSTTTIPSRNANVFPSTSGSNTLFGGNKEPVNSLEVRRVRFQFSGCVYRDMQFHIEFHADNEAIGLRDVDWTWTKFPWMNVMVGQIKMPNSRERQLSSGAIHFPERAFASQSIAAVGRETGIMLSGMDIMDLIDYKVMAATGLGFNNQFQQFDNTGQMVYSGRITAHPFGRVPFWAGDVMNSWSPLVEFSYTFLYGPSAFAMGELNAIRSFDLCNAYGATTTNTAAARAAAGCYRSNVTQTDGTNITGFTALPIGRANINPNAIGDWVDQGFDFTTMYRGFYFNTEYHYMTYSPNNSNRNLASFSQLRTITYAFDVGYFLIPRELEAVYRYQYLDINTGYRCSGTGCNQAQTNRAIMDASAHDFGFVWYLSRDHRHKLGAFGNLRHEWGGQPFHNNGFQINMQLAF